VAALTFKHIHQRDGLWCIVDLIGKHGWVRTVPMSTWVKVAIDVWATAAGIADGPVFRSVNRGGAIRETALSEKVVWQLIRPYARPPTLPESRLTTVAAHALSCDGRRAGKLEQIQMLLGHASVQTTERYYAQRIVM
jgi:integrase